MESQPEAAPVTWELGGGKKQRFYISNIVNPGRIVISTVKPQISVFKK